MARSRQFQWFEQCDLTQGGGPGHSCQLWRLGCSVGWAGGSLVIIMKHIETLMMTTMLMLAVMTVRWVVWRKRWLFGVWQVLLQLFHGRIHMEPARWAQGLLSLCYQSFVSNFEIFIWITCKSFPPSIFLLKTRFPTPGQRSRWKGTNQQIIWWLNSDRRAGAGWRCDWIQSPRYWWLPTARSWWSSWWGWCRWLHNSRVLHLSQTVQTNQSPPWNDPDKILTPVKVEHILLHRIDLNPLAQILSHLHELSVEGIEFTILIWSHLTFHQKDKD